MSSLSNLPYGKIIDYWYEKVKHKPYRYKFILTKILEIYSFKKIGNDYFCVDRTYNIEFPVSLMNKLSNKSRLAIIIPVYVGNKSDITKLNLLLKSLNELDKKADKIFIIDDYSPYKYNIPENITFIQLDRNSGPANARNIGIQLALEENFEIIAFTDSDCIVDKNWVSVIKNSFVENNKFNILSGKVFSYDKNWFGKYHDINGTLNGRIFKNDDKLLYGTTANLAITSLVASQIKFNENFPLAAGEDIEFCFNANMLGFAIKHIDNMKIYHNFGYSGNIIKNAKKFMRLFSKYGKGEKILLKEIPNYYRYFEKTKEISSI